MDERAPIPDATTQEEIRPLSDCEFTRFQTLIRALLGIHLTAAKKPLVVGRLSKRVRARGLVSFADYYKVVERDEAERQLMIDAICTNETRFFREPKQFDFLAGTVIPRWHAGLRAGTRAAGVRVWSAACSTGEEPYSLAMVLLDRLVPAIEILATDISSRVLARAREGIWPVEKKGEIPEAYLRRYMLRGTRAQEGRICAGPEIREVIRFASLNLMDRSYPVGPGFDAIFCRNVLIYFDGEARLRVVEQLMERLAPGGLLFLGQAESLVGPNLPIRSVGPSVYARLDGPPRAGRPAAAAESADRAWPHGENPEEDAAELPDGRRSRRG